MHTIEHAPNHQWSKGRDEDSVRHGPVLLAWVVGREETVVCSIANLIQTSGNDLAEAFFVAYLVHELVGAYEDARLAECGQSKDGA